MTNLKTQARYAHFYDQVLNEITFGKIEQGLNLLIGMLDAVAMRDHALEQAGSELRAHLLHQLLLEDPLYRHAANHPDDAIGMSTVIGDAGQAGHVSATGRKLFAVTAKLPIAGALQQRVKFQAKSDERAAANHICLGNYADTANETKLTAHLTDLRSRFSDQGILTFSAVLPQHLGSGWRSICLNWNPVTYDEQSLARAASAAGFKARTYCDEADCIVWAELRPVTNSQQEGSSNHGD